jgi:hypothetical protein
MYHNGQSIDITADNQYAPKPIITFRPGSEFTFTADIENGSSLNRVSIISTRGTEQKEMKATYNSGTGLWVASGFFDPANHSYVPGTISLLYGTSIEEYILDANCSFTQADYEELPKAIKDSTIEVNQNTFEENKHDGILDLSITLADSDNTKVDYIIDRKTINNSGNNITPEKLINDGYIPVKTSDGSTAYAKIDDNGFTITLEMVQFGLNVCYTTLLKIDLKGIYGQDPTGSVLGAFASIIGLTIDAIDLNGHLYQTTMAREQILNSNLSISEKQNRLRELDRVSQLATTARLLKMLSIEVLMAGGIALGALLAPAGLLAVMIGAIAWTGIGIANNFAWKYFVEDNRDSFFKNLLASLLNFDIRFAIDPSGYIYEAVASNRLQGVETTAYWKENTEDTPAIWDASEFGQINPIFTNTDGAYVWDVPEGLWQVKCELVGYETSYSDWLPVPPPQVDINIGMVSYAAPKLETIKIYDTYAVASFDKYMLPHTITAASLVMKDSGGNTVGYTLEYSEDDKDKDSNVLAREYILRYNDNFVASEGATYTISVTAEAKSYANVSATPGSKSGTLESATAFTVSGQIKSYNPQHPTTLKLQGENITYPATIDAEKTGSGQWTQEFIFEGVEPGLYTLVVSKEAHTDFIVHNIVVDDQDVDLTEDARPEVQLMTLRCGDINGDGNINNSDLTILWRQANYNRSAAAADEKLCDLNGDGLINNIDLTILWLAYNYNRGEIVI